MGYKKQSALLEDTVNIDKEVIKVSGHHPSRNIGVLLETFLLHEGNYSTQKESQEF